MTKIDNINKVVEEAKNLVKDDFLTRINNRNFETEITNIKANYVTYDSLTENYHNKTAIDTKVSTLTQSITSVQDNLNKYLTWTAIEG